MHSSAHEAIEHDSAEDKPCRSDRAPQCATDFRFSNSRIVADRNLDNPRTSFGRPFTIISTAQPYVSSCRSSCRKTSARAARNGPRSVIFTPYKTRIMAAARRLPKVWCQGSAPRIVLFRKARTERDVRSTFDDWRQQKRQLIRSIAVVSVEEHDDVRRIGCRESGQTGASVSAAWFAQDARSHVCCDLWRPVAGIAVDNQNFADKIGRQVSKNSSDGLRFIMRWNDDGDAH